MVQSDIAVGLIEVVIPDGETESALTTLPAGVYPVGIFHPAVDTSAALVFNVAETKNATPVPLNSGGSPLSITIDNTAAGYEPLSPSQWAGIQHFQIAVADAQTGAKTFKVATRSY